MLEQIYGEGSFEHAGGIECKFACVSGSYALYDNANWIRADENNGKAAIVVVSDIAKYDIGSTGEYTQGAGAVALLVKEDPRLLAFDPKVPSTTIKNEYDFYRPFGKETPLVNGSYSNLLYLISDRKSTRLNSSHANISYAVFCLKTKTINGHCVRCIFAIASSVPLSQVPPHVKGPYFTSSRTLHESLAPCQQIGRAHV